MLGQPMSMLIPQVLGFRLHGELPEGATATDLVLTVTEMLRARGVVGMFVEFYGAGLGAAAARRPRDDRQHVAGVRLDLRDLPDRRRDAQLPRADPAARRSRSRSSRPTRKRAGPVARRALRGADLLRRRSSSTSSTVEPSLAGPKRPQDRVALSSLAGGLPRGARATTCPSDGDQADAQDEAVAESYPASDPPANGAPGHEPLCGRRRPASSRPRGARHRAAASTARRRSVTDRRRELRARPRPRRDRGDHELHEHVQPLRDGRRRDPRAQRARSAACGASRGSRPRSRPARRSSPNTSTAPA